MIIPDRCDKRYSAVEHLAYSLWLNHNPKERHMAMFTAYFDASGHSADTGVGACLFVTGFVASVERWLEFETAWLGHLDENDIEPPFHMTDFISSKCQYASWKGQKAKRDTFLAKAVRIIKDHTRKPFSNGVVIEDLKRMFREFEVPAMPEEPYPWCAIQIFTFVNDWTKSQLNQGRVNPLDHLEYVFETGDLYRGKFMEIARDVYGITPKFMDKDSCVPFQACDLVAWAHRRALSGYRKGEVRAPSAYADIMRHLPADASKFHTWRTMEAVCIKAGFLRRDDG